MAYNGRLIAVGVLVVILIGIAWYATTPRPLTEDEQSGLANPASVHCEQDLGGSLEIVNGEGGQTGYCHLPDGRVCEEWTLFRDNACVGTASTTPQATSTPSNPSAMNTVTLALGETGTAAGFVITPKEVLEDSRCPAGVYCIQAGRVRLSATIGRGAVTFVSGVPLPYEGQAITLSEVAPLKTAQHAIAKADYRFTFVVGAPGATATDTPAEAAVRAQAAAQFAVPPPAISIMSATAKDWPDSCLGLAASGEMCAQIVTSGYEITVEAAGATHIFRTNRDGSVVRRAS